MLSLPIQNEFLTVHNNAGAAQSALPRAAGKTDGSNSSPELMEMRDGFCSLGNEPSLYRVDIPKRCGLQEEIAMSCRGAIPVAMKKNAFSRRMDLQWPTNDRMVQKSRFDNGLEVTVNFRPPSSSGTGKRKIHRLPSSLRFPPEPCRNRHPAEWEPALFTKTGKGR